ncbi:F-box/RNI-like/FBD-like domains-containing protein, partial [Striga asiatica]
IGALPDDVLLHVLSFLPTTRLSVCTSVLSRRWRSLWARVPLLSFEYDSYSDRSFGDIFTEVVSAHKGQTVHTFRLTTDHDFNEFEIEGWIAALVSRNIRNISIFVSWFETVWTTMPNCLLMCETLVELRIGGYVVLPAAGDVCLPALKRLYIEGAESLPRLISGCPVLEELSIIQISPNLYTFDSHLHLSIGSGCCSILPMPAKKQPPLDRLGALPDDVLLHILSFLPTTRLSVCTSVLSRRWRSLWAHVPLLSFQCGGGCERRFRDIVTEVVSAHKGQTVHTFQLTNYSSDYEFEIEGWIPALVFRNVRNISIYLSGLGGERVMMPNCLLMCETLVELKIGGYVVIPAAFDVCLPALKRLLIGGAESLPRLISGCPVLEELDIFNCD